MHRFCLLFVLGTPFIQLSGPCAVPGASNGLSACVTARQWQQGLQLLEQLRRRLWPGTSSNMLGGEKPCDPVHCSSNLQSFGELLLDFHVEPYYMNCSDSQFLYSTYCTPCSYWWYRLWIESFEHPAGAANATWCVCTERPAAFAGLKRCGCCEAVGRAGGDALGGGMGLDDSMVSLV